MQRLGLDPSRCTLEAGNATMPGQEKVLKCRPTKSIDSRERMHGQGKEMGAISRAVMAIGFGLVLAGCVTTNAARLGTATAERPALLPQDVALYRVASQVPRQYEEIALLNSSGDSGLTDEARMFESMRKKAGELGANGVILDAVSEPGHGAKVAAAIFGVSAKRKGKALAIWVFPVGAPTAAQAAPAQADPAQVNTTPAKPTETCVSCQGIGRSL